MVIWNFWRGEAVGCHSIIAAEEHKVPRLRSGQQSWDWAAVFLPLLGGRGARPTWFTPADAIEYFLCHRQHRRLLDLRLRWYGSLRYHRLRMGFASPFRAR